MNRGAEAVARCPIPMPDGSDCWRLPEPDGYAGMCTEHMHDVTRAWLGDTPIRRDRCPHCGMLSLSRDRATRASAVRQKFGPPMAAWRNWITRPAA